MAHGCCCKHFTDEEDNKPSCPLTDHFCQRYLKVRLIQYLNTSEFLDIFRIFFFHYIHHVVEGNDAEQQAIEISNRQGHPVRLLKYFYCYFLVILGIEGNVLPVHQFVYLLLKRSKQELAC